MQCLFLVALCQQASNHEVFLLACAALANMTLMDNMMCDFLIQFNTSRVLVEACVQHKAHSLFAKDQVYFSCFSLFNVSILYLSSTSHLLTSLSKMCNIK